MYLCLNVVTKNNKLDLKFGLTMATRRSHKEVTLRTKYEALKDLEEKRTNKEVSNKFNVATSTVST